MRYKNHCFTSPVIFSKGVAAGCHGNPFTIVACFFSNSSDHRRHWRCVISRELPGLCDQCLAKTLESVERVTDRGVGLYHLLGVAGLSPDKTNLHGLLRTWVIFFFGPMVC